MSVANGHIIRILVADDHSVVRDGLVAMLSTQPDFRVVGQASSGADVLENIYMAEPHVVLLDLEMPELDGVEALRQIAREHPHVKVLVFTSFDDDERIVGAVQAGARAYLPKGSSREEVFSAIRTIDEGGSLPPMTQSPESIYTTQRSGSGYAKLTEREFEVLELLAQGLTNKEISAKLTITVRTVKYHVSSILEKLAAGNRTEAVRIASQRGLIDLQNH